VPNILADGVYHKKKLFLFVKSIQTVISINQSTDAEIVSFPYFLSLDVWRITAGKIETT
jgi:hypothetical protein